MFEETLRDISDQRLLAMESQMKRTSKLEFRCPSGLHSARNMDDLPCYKLSSDPCWCNCEGEVLRMDIIKFDEGKA